MIHVAVLRSVSTEKNIFGGDNKGILNTRLFALHTEFVMVSNLLGVLGVMGYSQ